MEAFNIGGIFALILLISGIILTVITIRRMILGQINVPGWEKLLLSAAMILMQLILLLSMLPPLEVKLDNPFVETYTNIVSPADPSQVTVPN